MLTLASGNQLNTEQDILRKLKCFSGLTGDVHANCIINQNIFVRKNFLCFFRMQIFDVIPIHRFINEAPGLAMLTERLTQPQGAISQT